MLLGSAFVLQAQTNFQRLLSFGPYPVSGTVPRAKLLEASDGLLYGTTYAGGSNNLGTIFRIAKDGSRFTTLLHLSGPDFPYGGLVEGASGSLYGTTSGGGSLNGGTVFRINPDGSGFVPIHNFDPGHRDGVAPAGNLVKAPDGFFYGTCSSGGTTNLGSVFKISADGLLYGTLHSFLGKTNGNDGANPAAGLVAGLDGGLYGTTQGGGGNDLGSVFRISTDGVTYALLHHFAGSPNDGRVPLTELVQTADGLLYGTTVYGGANNVGTLFRVDTNGDNYAVLKSFSVGPGGNQPLGGLAVGLDGALYGTTRYGGQNDGGTAFRFNPTDSAYTVMHDFLGTGGDGSQPFAGLLLGSDGAWYGSTFYGGDLGVGAIFRLFSGRAAVTITGISVTPGSVFLTFAGGAARQAYAIQSTPSLSPANWQSIGTNTATIDGTFQFTDSTATTSLERFYRTAQP